jgi:hypothetical protein
MEPMRLIAAAALAITLAGCATSAPQQPAPQQPVQQQLPPTRVYALHSASQGGCPGLDWHIVLGADGGLNGMISWNNMQSAAHASGSVNAQAGTFLMTATELPTSAGGMGRTVTIDGTISPQNGGLIANIQGPNLSCRGIHVPFVTGGPGGN